MVKLIWSLFLEPMNLLLLIILKLRWIVKYIKNIKLSNKDLNTLVISGFGQAIWTFISFIYKGGWDKLKMKNQDITFCQCIATQFSSLKIPKPWYNNLRKNIQVSKLVEVSLLLLLPIPPRFSKSKLEKFKYYQKKDTNSAKNTSKRENNPILKFCLLILMKSQRSKKTFPTYWQKN